jgi:hypothetical protein
MCGETLLIEEAKVNGSTTDVGLRMLLLWKHLHRQRLLLLARTRLPWVPSMMYHYLVRRVPMLFCSSESDLAGYVE